MTPFRQSPIVIPIAQNGQVLPEQFFAHLAGKPWSFWLDSCDSNHVNANWDIFVWEPISTITCDNGQITVDCVESSELNLVYSDPFAAIKHQLNELFGSKPCLQDYPFAGGAVGLFNYDLGRTIEKLPTLAENDIPIAEMHVGIYHSAVLFDRHNKTYVLVTLLEDSSSLESEVLNYLNTPFAASTTPFKLSSSWQANMSKNQYIDKFSAVQDYLLSGDCYQINLAQRFFATYQGDEFQAYLTLRKQNKAPFSAFMRLPQASILSISPERFLQVTQRRVETKPIKGTRPRHTEPSQDKANAEELINSAKDQAENLMIVDLLRNDISRCCEPGSVQVPSLFAIESFPAVHHLVSTVVGTLSKDKHATDLLKAAFPGGSITGAPKIRAMEIIEELEPHRRNAYCGAIGYISACGNMDTNITIRTLVCYNGRVHCWAGGGLVADSIAEQEYQETFDKVQKILPVLSNLK